MASPDATTIQLTLAAEKVHLTRQISALHTLYPTEPYAVHPSPAGTLTIRAPPGLGFKLNQTLGIGAQEPLTTQILEKIEEYYEPDGAVPNLHVPTFTDGITAEVLLKAGYEPVPASIARFGLRFTESQPGVVPDHRVNGSAGDVVIVPYERGEDVEAFVAASVQGFQSNGRAAELLALLAESAAAREDTVRSRAVVDGKLAGTAAMAVLDVGGTKVANMFLDSTFPEVRGKGVHIALLRARIAAAREAGCEFVVASARAGTGSARNISKAGLKEMYQDITYTKKTDQ